MLRVLVLVVSIALADALNPGTIVPALYFATTDDGRRRVAAFGAAFFGVNLVAGLILVLGPGQLLLDAISRPSETAKFTVEVVAGGSSSSSAPCCWRVAQRLRRRIQGRSRRVADGAQAPSARRLPRSSCQRRCPTSPRSRRSWARRGTRLATRPGRGLQRRLHLPVIAILVALSVAGPSIEPRLRRIGDRLRAGWQRAAAWLALVAGLLLVGFGATGLVGLH